MQGKLAHLLGFHPLYGTGNAAAVDAEFHVKIPEQTAWRQTGAWKSHLLEVLLVLIKKVSLVGGLGKEEYPVPVEAKVLALVQLLGNRGNVVLRHMDDDGNAVAALAPGNVLDRDQELQQLPPAKAEALESLSVGDLWFRRWVV